MSIATINGIPVFSATIDEDCGMQKVSLVDLPAVERDFLAFSGKEMQRYAIADEPQRRVLGCVMRADFPIYRNSPELGEYYIVYTADIIKTMAEKYLAENRANLVNLMHEDGSDVEGVEMVQFFIKDTAKGINPKAFDVADGSLFAEYHILNDEVWAKVVDGTFRGFSLEGVFGMEAISDKKYAEDIVSSLVELYRKHQFSNNDMSKVNKILAALGAMPLKFGTMTTDKGVIRWEGEDAIAVGDEVQLVPSEEGAEPVKAEAGDYVGDEIIVVVGEDGKVAEINEKKAEEVVETPAEPAAEEPAEETEELKRRKCLEGEEPAEQPAEEPEVEIVEPAAEEVVDELAELKKAFAEFKEKTEAEIEALKELVKKSGEEIEVLRKTPKSAGVVEEYKRQNAPLTMEEAIRNARRK